MSTDAVFDIDEGAGSVMPHLNARGHACALTGLSIMAMPPGRVDLRFDIITPTLNILPYKGDIVHHLRHNGEDRRHIAELGARAMFHREGDFEIKSTNETWECLLEMDLARLPHLAPEQTDGADNPVDFFATALDESFRVLADLAIRHLRGGNPDPLYTEGLSIAMAARALAYDRGTIAVSNHCTDPRIARAIDYIEAHLADDLSIAAIASVAGMSPSWFQSAFRTVTGQPVFAHVRERRLERARILLADRRLSLSQIAFACGFSSHSHMSRLFRVRFGASPREMR